MRVKKFSLKKIGLKVVSPALPAWVAACVSAVVRPGIVYPSGVVAWWAGCGVWDSDFVP